MSCAWSLNTGRVILDQFLTSPTFGNLSYMSCWRIEWVNSCSVRLTRQGAGVVITTGFCMVGAVKVEERVTCWPLSTTLIWVTYRSLRRGDRLALDPGTTVLEWETQAQRQSPNPGANTDLKEGGNSPAGGGIWGRIWHQRGNCRCVCCLAECS